MTTSRSVPDCGSSATATRSRAARLRPAEPSWTWRVIAGSGGWRLDQPVRIGGDFNPNRRRPITTVARRGTERSSALEVDLHGPVPTTDPEAPAKQAVEPQDVGHGAGGLQEVRDELGRLRRTRERRADPQRRVRDIRERRWRDADRTATGRGGQDARARCPMMIAEPSKGKEPILGSPRGRRRRASGPGTEPDRAYGRQSSRHHVRWWFVTWWSPKATFISTSWEGVSGSGFVVIRCAVAVRFPAVPEHRIRSRRAGAPSPSTVVDETANAS